jgi:hypothetical protein
VIRPSHKPGRCDICGRTRPVRYHPSYGASFCEQCAVDPQAMPEGRWQRLKDVIAVYYDSLMIAVNAANRAWRKRHPKRDRRDV